MSVILKIEPREYKLVKIFCHNFKLRNKKYPLKFLLLSSAWSFSLLLFQFFYIYIYLSTIQNISLQLTNVIISSNKMKTSGRKVYSSFTNQFCASAQKQSIPIVIKLILFVGLRLLRSISYRFILFSAENEKVLK